MAECAGAAVSGIAKLGEDPTRTPDSGLRDGPRTPPFCSVGSVNSSGIGTVWPKLRLFLCKRQ